MTFSATGRSASSRRPAIRLAIAHWRSVFRESGVVILSGDVAHSERNFIHRRVPSFNFDAGQTRASMDEIERIIRAENARLWINHDARQSSAIPHAPQWVE